MPVAKKNTKVLALSGVLLALSMALLFLRTFIPVLDFSIYILISFFTGIILQESNDKWAWLFFTSIVLLSLILPVDKLAFFLLYTFFGYYGILKYYIEKLDKRWLGFLLKTLFIIAAVLLNYIFAKAFLPGVFSNQVKLYLILAVATVFVFIYDYVYTTAMVFYSNRIKKATGGSNNA